MVARAFVFPRILTNVITLWLAFACIFICHGDEGEEHSLHCWYGVSEDLSGFKNMDCRTKETYALGSSSRTGRSAGNGTGPSHCMVFKYYDELTTGNGHEDPTIQTTKAIYSCDFTQMCLNKVMEQSYEEHYEQYDGNVVCCDTDNCNSHRLEFLERRCYNAERVKDHTPGYGDAIPVPHPHNACLRITVKQLGGDQPVILRQTFGTDTKGLCAQYQLTDTKTRKQACFTSLNSTTDVEEETCCCYEDRCFKPSWLTDGSVLNLSINKESPVQWQKILYVCVGIGFVSVIMAASVVVIKRLYRRRKYIEAPKPYSKMTYKSVRADGLETDADNVQILTAINHNSTIEDQV